VNRKLVIIFLAVELLLYAAFLTEDIAGINLGGIVLKYISILLCLAFAAVCAFRGGDKFVFPALILTALADLFLLVLNRYFIVGVIIFIGAQTVYLIRLRFTFSKKFKLLRIALPVLIAILLFALKMGTVLNLLVGVYFSQLLVNALQAWTLKGRRWRIFAVGLTLFIGCDLCVGIFNMSAMFPAALASFAEVGMWLFYLPSQVLIALSAMPKENAQKERA